MHNRKRSIGVMSIKPLLIFIFLFHLALADVLPSPQCISSMSTIFTSESEMYYWRNVFVQLTEMKKMDNVKDELFALLGYYLMRSVEYSCEVNDLIEVDVNEEVPKSPKIYVNGPQEEIQTTSESPDSADCAVLYDLYKSTGGGKYWDHNKTWEHVENECCTSHCSGVACNKENRVTSLEVYGLSGTLPKSLWGLSELETLILVGKGAEDEEYPHGMEQLFDYVVMNNTIPTLLSGDIPSFDGSSLQHLGTLVLYGSFTGGSVVVSETITTLMLIGEWNTNMSLFISSLEKAKKLDRLQVCGWFTGALQQKIPRSAKYIDIEGDFENGLEDFIKGLDRSISELSLSGRFESFDGETPPSFSDFTSLTVLSLNGNFHCDIPHLDSHLEKLTYLSLVGYFGGEIPTTFSELKNLKFVRIDGLSTHSSLGSMSLCNCSHLEHIEVQGEFRGLLPNCISNLENLTHVHLSGEFIGPIPSSYWNLNLKELHLLGYINGHFDSVSNMNNLLSLRLVGTFRNLPSGLSSLTQLVHVEIIGHFEDDISMSLISLPNLKTLHLVGSFRNISTKDSVIKGGIKPMKDLMIIGKFDSECPEELTKMSNITSITLCCGLTMTSTDLFKYMTKAVTIDFSLNTIKKLPPIGDLGSLQVLVLDHCNIQQLSPLSHLGSLRYLSLAHNRITDTDSSSIFYIKSLEQVNLSYNNLVHSLLVFARTCSHKDRLRNLISVSFANNRLTQLVLTQSCEVPVLRNLDLSNNKLTGQLPKLIPQVFPKLRVANFSRNSLIYIPDSFTQAMHLDVLDVRMNKGLYGSVGHSSFWDYTHTRTTYRNSESQASWTCSDTIIKTPFRNYTLLADDTYQRYEQCICDIGFYMTPPNCMGCDHVSPEAYCPGDGNVYAPQGYWATPPGDKGNGIFPKKVLPCSGAGTSDTRCRPKSKDYGKTCEIGYRGRMCSGCDTGYFSVGDRCMMCMEGKIAHIFLLVAVAFGFVIFVGIGFSRKFTSSGTAKILIIFIQTLYYIWCQRSVGFGGYTSSITSFVGQWQLPSPSCYIHGWTYRTTYIANVTFLLVVMIGDGVVILFGNMILKIRRCDTKEWNQRSKTALLFVIYFSYVGFSSQVVEPILCNEDPGTHESYMTNVPYERCDNTLRITSICLLLGVVLMLPVLLGIRYLQKGNPLIGSPLHPFSIAYRKERWMWDIILTGRRVLLIFGFVFIPQNWSFQSVSICSIMGISSILQSIHMPFGKSSENILETFSLVLVQINYSVVLQYGSPQTITGGPLMIILLVVDTLVVVYCLWRILLEPVVVVVKGWRDNIRKSGESDQPHELNMPFLGGPGGI